MKIHIHLNQQDRDFDVHPGTLLIELLQEQGLKEDNVLVDGQVREARRMLAAQANGRSVVTIEHLQHPHPIQEALTDSGTASNSAAVLAIYQLLNENREPTREEAHAALEGLHPELERAIDAVVLASSRLRDPSLQLV
jgi:aerobic-type carbon monoxide dehydrogenase small subunit (CoxS/CutS family)